LQIAPSNGGKFGHPATLRDEERERTAEKEKRDGGKGSGGGGGGGRRRRRLGEMNNDELCKFAS